MRVLAASLAAGVISTVLIGCESDDNETAPTTKFDDDITYKWETQTETLTIKSECPSGMMYSEFLTHPYDTTFDKAKAEETLSCMSCLGTQETGLDFADCGGFTDGSKVETCAPFEELKTFAKNADTDYANLKKVLTAFETCGGDYIPVITDLTITEYSESDSKFPCYGVDLTEGLDSDSDKATIEAAFSCMKCAAEKRDPAVSLSGCHWTSSESIVYEPEGCNAYLKLETLLESADAAEKAKNQAAIAACSEAAATE